MSPAIPCCRSKRAPQPTTRRFWSRRSRHWPSSRACRIRCTAFWCSPARQRRSVLGVARAALGRRGLGAVEDRYQQALVSGQGRADQEPQVRRPRSAAPDPRLSPEGMARTTPYAKETDFVFPSLKAEGRVPLSPAVFVADHLRPAAKAAGVQIADGQRFGCIISGIRFPTGW